MLDNQVVAVSGACGRIGESLCRAIVLNGGKVIAGDVKQESGERLISELGESSSKFFRGDLTDPKAVQEMLIAGTEKFGMVDAAVHCAYPFSEGWGTRFEDLNASNLKLDLFNQLGGTILFSQKVIQYFRNQGHGNLIHVSSIQGVKSPKFDHYNGTEMNSPIEYSAIKAGVISVTRYLAKYCKDQNIRVNCISPGGILSDQPINFQKKYKEDCISKGMLDAEDINGALLFLLSPNSKYINGQNIIVDDGWTL